MATDDFDILLVTAPGHEAALRDEAQANGFSKLAIIPGGVTVRGGWAEVWRANLELRGASRVLARIASFRVPRLEHLEPKARGIPWGKILRRDVPFRVEATCKSSRIFHTGAAAERIARAIHTTLGAIQSDEAAVAIKARIEDDICTIAIDTSGEPLHKRGHKAEVNAAPMRETMAAMFLRQCGYRGREAVLDPMCGSGTFVIEAAEIAARLKPGRSRSFAFEQLATFDAASFAAMRARGNTIVPEARFFGSDEDAGAIRISRANAARAGVDAFASFEQTRIEDLQPPACAPGLVIANPPYGTRIGDAKQLRPLYRAFGQTMKQRFAGWRVGLVAADETLAAATGLSFAAPSEPVLHGGIRVRLYLAG